MKKIEDFIHLHLGCDVKIDGGEHPSFFGKLYSPCKYSADRRYIVLNKDIFTNVEIKDIKLILRPLSDMTEEEKMYADREDSILQKAEFIHYLLKQGFDIFNLHQDGLCLYRKESGELY